MVCDKYVHAAGDSTASIGPSFKANEIYLPILSPQVPHFACKGTQAVPV